MAELDPVFLAVHEATGHLPNRKQRLMAAYYVRLLQTGNPIRLKQSVPANLYPALRHFLADADWDHREVVWRAAARALDVMDVEWFEVKVTSVARQYSFAWLAAYDADHVICADLVLLGPAGLRRQPANYVPAQVDVLATAPDALLGRAPVAIGGVLAEDAGVRTSLENRGLTYSAAVRPSSRILGMVVEGRRGTRLRDYAVGLRSDAIQVASVAWITRPVTLRLPDGATRRETLVCYWQQSPELAGVVLTNEQDPSRLAQIFDPARDDRLMRARPRFPWRRTGLRGPRAWEHHAALTAVLEAHRVQDDYIPTCRRRG